MKLCNHLKIIKWELKGLQKQLKSSLSSKKCLNSNLQIQTTVIHRGLKIVKYTVVANSNEIYFTVTMCQCDNNVTSTTDAPAHAGYEIDFHFASNNVLQLSESYLYW